MASWSAWLPDVMPRAAGLSLPMMEQEVRRAAQEFMRRTRVWTEWLDAEAGSAGNQEYYFDLPQGAIAVRIERATLDGQPLAVESFRARPADWTVTHGTASGMVSADRATFYVGGDVQGRQIQAQVSLAPGERSRGIPDGLFDQYRDHITHGALARLLAMPGQDWTNFALAPTHIAAFERAMDSVHADAWRGHTQNTPRARTRWC